MIPRSTRLAEAPSFGKPIIHYDKYSTGAAAYELLAQEFLARLDQADVGPLSRRASKLNPLQRLTRNSAPQYTSRKYRFSVFISVTFTYSAAASAESPPCFCAMSISVWCTSLAMWRASPQT